MKMRESPSADDRRKFSIIWGEKTTTQQAIDIELKKRSVHARKAVGRECSHLGAGNATNPKMPLNASISIFDPCVGGYISRNDVLLLVRWHRTELKQRISVQCGRICSRWR